jgi:hypothetical protein
VYDLTTDCSNLGKHCHTNDIVVFADGKQGARNRKDKGADKVENLF